MSTSTKPPSLTSRQREVWQFICQYHRDNGRPPTFREICSRFQIQSPNGAWRHARALVKKGYIAIDPKKACGIRILISSDSRLLPEREAEIRLLAVSLDRSPTWSIVEDLLAEIDNLRMLLHIRPLASEQDLSNG